MTAEQLTLEALLAHPANGGLRMIVGSGSTVWEQAVVEQDEPGLPSSGRGQLAILTTALSSAPWQQDALMRRVHERGFPIVALPRAERLSAGARQIAERLGLAVLDVDRPIDLTKACWELSEAGDALTLRYVRRVAQSFAYSAEDLAGLLRHLAGNVGHGLAVVDASGVLHEAGGHLEDSLRKDIRFDAWLDVARSGSSSAVSVRIESPTHTGLRLVLFGQGLSSAQLRALSAAAEIAMPAIAARILIDDVAAVNDAAASSGLLRDFLDLRGGSDPEVERRMLEHGWKTAGYHLGFRVIGRGRVDPFQLLRHVAQGLGRLGTDSHATTSGRGVTGWLSFPDMPPPNQVERAVSALRELHTQTRRSFNIATGVGSMQHGSPGLASTLGEAADAARIAADRASTGWFLRVDSLGLDQLLLAWTGSDTFIPAAESLLASLRKDRNELLTTLSAYLDHESNIVATATALNLHRNTVATRIHRAQEILGIDFSDPESRLALHLACRALLR